MTLTKRNNGVSHRGSAAFFAEKTANKIHYWKPKSYTKDSHDRSPSVVQGA